MSTLANQDPKKQKRRGNDGLVSARLARFGIPVPPRIAAFFDGPELAAHEGVRAWGLEGFSSDMKMKVKWASPRLARILEYAQECEFEEDAETKYLPIAALGSESHMFAVDITNDQLPVCFFDYESGYKVWAPDFESFLKRLLKKGERTPGEKLAKAYEQASELNKDNQHEAVIELLEPIVAQFPTTLDHRDDTRDTVGAAWNLLGIAYEKRPDLGKAMHAYETALALGTDSAGLNICDLWLNEYKDYPKLVAFAEERRSTIWRMGSNAYAWFHIRNYLGQGYLLVGLPKDAIRSYHQISELRGEDADKIAEAIKDLRALIAERPEVDRATAESILGWLDVPVTELSDDSWRAWWATLPAKAVEEIKEALHFEGEPSAADLARVATMTELNVKQAGMTGVAWVTRLAHLEDLDVEGNQLTDVSPLAALVRLRKLDISENQITSLRPLAPLVRLERLSAGENPLTGVEGLEGMKRLNYLHLNEAGLVSIEPLRGLPELVDVTLYNNKIEDLSPLV
ncbi:MAG: leucine-rich repeat domain-containing protein, partial [Kofleriaceae bacterium]